MLRTALPTPASCHIPSNKLGTPCSPPRPELFIFIDTNTGGYHTEALFVDYPTGASPQIHFTDGTAEMREKSQDMTGHALQGSGAGSSAASFVHIS